MTIATRRTHARSMLGGAISTPTAPCRHGPAREVDRWTGEPGTAGTVTVVGAGKMGLPLAVQFARHGWRAVAVDIDPRVVDAINAGRSPVTGEPGLATGVADARAAGRLRATLDGAAAAAASDVVVLIVPVMLDEQHRPDRTSMDAAAGAIGRGLRPGATVVFETTLPVGDTRGRYVPLLEAASGLTAEVDLHVAFSPERLYSGHVFENLAAYPKLVGGVGPRSTDRAARFYASVLDSEVVAMASAEAAELAKLAETTYRDLNIAYANQLAGLAERLGIDVLEVIGAANSQPYSHIHEPGLGVGGHCIPVYPHFLLAGAPELDLVATARRVNDAQVDRALDRVEAELGGLRGAPVLVLGLTYRHGVRELAYSRALPLVRELVGRGAVPSAWDPLLDAETVERLGAQAWTWGQASEARAIVLQTADPVFRDLDPGWFPRLEVLLDGRNALRGRAFPDTVRVLGVGVPARGGRRTSGDGA